MNQPKISIFFTIAGIFILSFILTAILVGDPEYSENPEEKLAPTDWQFRQRAYPVGKIDKQAVLAALEYRNNHSQASPIEESNHINPWVFAGPTNIGGRITDIEMPASSLTTIYVGA
ncbi:MAG: hypothetical protein KDE26_23875, partial [Bacteroidetes bacterium]|nr:hypothetical protein [Bacteroidota bacterium]